MLPMRNFLLLLLVLALLFAACDTTQTRDCAAFYYNHNQWQNIGVQDSIQFSSEEELYTFVLTSQEFSVPHEEESTGGSLTGASDPDLVLCNMYADFLYTCSDLGVDMRIHFDQLEEYEQPIEQQSIFVEYSFKATGEEQYPVKHNLLIEPVADLQYDYIETLVREGRTYTNVFESVVPVPDTGEPSYRKIGVSRGAGLLYFFDRDGKEYFLVQ